jgi:hypothetical protein
MERCARAIGNDRVLSVGRADGRGILQSKDRELSGAVVRCPHFFVLFSTHGAAINAIAYGYRSFDP